MLFSRFEKYVDMVFSNAPTGSSLTNNQTTTLYAKMLSDEEPSTKAAVAGRSDVAITTNRQGGGGV